MWEHLLPELQKERNNGGVLEVDTDTISNITSHKAGYIDRENEVIPWGSRRTKLCAAP